MQRYFCEQAYTYDEAERKAREKYGDRLTILMHETTKIPGGFLNLFSREGVKITGIIPSNRSLQYRDAPFQKDTFQPSYSKEPSSPKEPSPLREQTFQKEPSSSREPSSSKEPSPLKELSSPREPLDFAGEKEKILAMSGL
ncbi:MAG: hypothetical protein FWF26_00740, partial [Treponema sp.]|nr:hypothetical protein [Treponema sp.]